MVCLSGADWLADGQGLGITPLKPHHLSWSLCFLFCFHQAVLCLAVGYSFYHIDLPRPISCQIQALYNSDLATDLIFCYYLFPIPHQKAELFVLLPVPLCLGTSHPCLPRQLLLTEGSNGRTLSFQPLVLSGDWKTSGGVWGAE